MLWRVEFWGVRKLSISLYSQKSEGCFAFCRWKCGSPCLQGKWFGKRFRCDLNYNHYFMGRRLRGCGRQWWPLRVNWRGLVAWEFSNLISGFLDAVSSCDQHLLWQIGACKEVNNKGLLEPQLPGERKTQSLLCNSLFLFSAVILSNKFALSQNALVTVLDYVFINLHFFIGKKFAVLCLEKLNSAELQSKVCSVNVCFILKSSEHPHRINSKIKYSITHTKAQ